MIFKQLLAAAIIGLTAASIAAAAPPDVVPQQPETLAPTDDPKPSPPDTSSTVIPLSPAPAEPSTFETSGAAAEPFTERLPEQQPPTASDEREPQPTASTSSQTEVGGRSFSQDEMAILWAIVIVAAVIACVSVWALARRTSERYGWPLILNGWNLLYVVGIVGGLFVASASPVVGFGLLALCWLTMLILNIVKTDFLTGLLATLVQPFALLTIVFVVMMVTARPKRVALD